MDNLEFSEKIKNIHLSHPSWKKAFKESFTQIAMACPSEIVSIVGPPRVGKSTLTVALRKALNLPGVKIDDSQSFSMCVAVGNDSRNGSFTTKVFTENALQETGNPFYCYKDLSLNQLAARSRIPEAAYRHALEQSIKWGKKKYIFFDEAQHILHAFKNDSITSILDSWKCLAQRTNSVLVLCGTYELKNILQTSGHVIGRNCNVHFPRYKMTAKDLAGFREVLEAYDCVLMEHGCRLSLLDNDEFIYEGSIGCVGHLNRWVRKALGNSFANECDLSIKHFSQTLFSKNEMQVLRNEICVGEQLYSKESEESELEELDLAPEKSTKNKTTSKPFKTKPKRIKEGNRLEGGTCAI